MEILWDVQPNSCIAKTILIVEDNTALGNLLREVLQNETTCQIFLVSSAEEAIRTLQTVNPQLFVLDYCLPGMNGLEFAERIRAMERYEQTPILLMSPAFPQGNIAKQHLRCLPKPFDLDSLLQMVEELLAV
jgi:CheY-like chemotaxis protein